MSRIRRFWTTRRLFAFLVGELAKRVGSLVFVLDFGFLATLFPLYLVAWHCRAEKKALSLHL